MLKVPTSHNSAAPNPLDEFQWEVQPAAEQMVREALDEAVGKSPFLADLARRMREETGTRLFDWVDHLVVRDAGGLRERLRNAGFIVDLSETAKGALQLAADSRYDLVISDLGLPDVSGLELMPQLLAEQPWLRGICLSGYGMEDDLQACRTAGFSEHLTKPVDMQRLLAAISRVSSAMEADREPGLDSKPA